MEDSVEALARRIYIQRNWKQYVKRYLYSSFYDRRFQNSENKQTNKEHNEVKVLINWFMDKENMICNHNRIGFSYIKN